jgi:hypothetical protein
VLIVIENGNPKFKTMKTLLIILFFIPLSCFAPGLNEINIPVPEPFLRTYSDTEKLQAIIFVESSNGENRYNPGETEAVGLLQIHPVMVDECNRIAGYQKYQYSDRNSDKMSVAMFWEYQNYWNPDHNFANMAMDWVGGPAGHKKTSTLKYLQLANNQLYQA